MNELLAVLCRLPASRPTKVREALGLVEALGLTRVGNGHELLSLAADFAGRWKTVRLRRRLRGAGSAVERRLAHGRRPGRTADRPRRSGPGARNIDSARFLRRRAAAVSSQGRERQPPASIAVAGHEPARRHSRTSPPQHHHNAPPHPSRAAAARRPVAVKMQPGHDREPPMEHEGAAAWSAGFSRHAARRAAERVGPFRTHGAASRGRHPAGQRDGLARPELTWRKEPCRRPRSCRALRSRAARAG